MPVNVLRVLLIDARAVTKHFITDRHVIATTDVDVISYVNAAHR